MKVKVRAHTGSKKPRIEQRDGVLEIYISERPIEGKANEALVKILAGHFNVSRSQVRLAAGQKSKLKTFEINN